MNNFSAHKENVRKYLLGILDDESERRRIEESIMLSDEFEEQISIAEDELIEEFLDGELPAKENDKFQTFFLAAPQRKEKLDLVKNLRRLSAEQKRRAGASTGEKARSGFFSLFLSPAFLRFAVILLLLSGIGLIVWRTAFYESDVDKGLAQLNKAYQKTRPLESRSTIDFGYAEFTVTRGASSSPADQKSLAKAERFLIDASENPNDAEAHHALGLFYLNKKQFDNALEEFNIALKITPDNAKLLSDSGAAFLEKANQSEAQEKYDETFENLARALEAINRALQIDADLREALFNKAFVLEKMNRTNQAIEAWQKYIEADPSSDWTNEARRNIEKLQQKPNQSKDKSEILQDFFEAFRRRDEARAWQIASQTKELITGAMIQQQLAKSFLESDRQSRKEEADEILSAFFYLGEIEERKTGDGYFSDLAQFYSAASAAQKADLSAAHSKLDEGYDFILSQKTSEAFRVFEESRELFIKAGNKAESHIADYQIAYCLSQQGKTDESNEVLQLALAQTNENNYWLKALFYGWLGSNYSGSGEFSQAIAYDKKSLETAQKISDTYNIQRSLNQLANEYRRIGNRSETLNYGFRGMLTSDLYYLSPRQQFRDLYFFSQTSIEAGFYDTAIAFSLENLSLVENSIKDNWFKHSGTTQLATIYGKTGKYRESLDEFQKSIEIASTISDETKVKQLTARSYLSLANMQRENDKCADANENYDKSLALYRAAKSPVNIYDGEKGKLLCDVAQNNEASVREKMQEIIRSFDEYRGKLSDNEQRTAFFNVEQNVYDAAIGFFYANLNDPVTAFNYSENSRSRTLLSLINSGGAQTRTLSLDEIRASMPEKVQLIYYTVLPDKLLIWHISKDSYKSYEKIIEQKKLFETVGEYRKLIEARSGDDKIRRAAKELSDLLLGTLDLEPASAICFIADKTLFQIPFSSLISPDSDKYLIEDFPVMLSPSATVFVEQTNFAKQKQATDETILSIGNPSFSRKNNSELADLPAAEDEARNIASLYSKKISLTAKQAAKQAVLNDLKTAEIVHFAGHYVPNLKNPSLSKFLLAADSSKSDDSDLPVREIIEQKLPLTKLVVLSACETGVEKIYNGEGMIGAARAFLAADVPLVVASQWSVESESTAELMVKFHNYRKRENLTTVEALRRAQIDMLSDEKSRFQKPYYWSGFSPIGGYAEY